MAAAMLVDTIQIFDVGSPVTVGTEVTRPYAPASAVIPGLVQTTVLENAIESRVSSAYSIKVARGTAIHAGQAIKVITCEAEPDLVGKMLLLDKVSQNGIALIRKAVASDFEVVNQEGKEGLA